VHVDPEETLETPTGPNDLNTLVSGVGHDIEILVSSLVKLDNSS